MADDDGNFWRTGLIGSNGANYGNSVYWRDYGRTLETRSGLLFGYHLDLAQQADGTTYSCTFIDAQGIERTAVVNRDDKAGIINEILQKKWPNGLTVFQSPMFEGNITTPGNEGYFDMRGMLVTAIMKNGDGIEITYYFGYDYDKKV